jgi:membrane fusion protein, multidrug efflux system
MAEMRRLACVAALFCGFLGSANADQASQAAIPVGVAQAVRKPVTNSLEFVGRIEAINRVEVRARVKGFLDGVLFADGQTVKEGTPLYQIEKGLFEAAVQQAQGALERSQAAYTLAQLQTQRAVQLFSRGNGTAVDRDRAVAQEAQSKGAVLADEANLTTARINLSYTDIASPIIGRIGRSSVTKGNVVGPESGPLTLIVSQDPMYVTFPVSQRELLRAQDSQRDQKVDGIKVRVRFADGALYDQIGAINFIGVSVDKTTDTVTLRATIANPQNRLIDGQLVRVILEAGNPVEQTVVPQAALIADQAGVYVFIVEDEKAQVRRLKTAGELGPDVIVTDGLKGGEQVIVEGLQSVRAGAPVRATPVSPSLAGD